MIEPTRSCMDPTGKCPTLKRIRSLSSFFHIKFQHKCLTLGPFRFAKWNSSIMGTSSAPAKLEQFVTHYLVCSQFSECQDRTTANIHKRRQRNKSLHHLNRIMLPQLREIETVLAHSWLILVSQEHGLQSFRHTLWSKIIESTVEGIWNKDSHRVVPRMSTL